MNLIEFYREDIVTSLLFGGMMFVMLIKFLIIFLRIKKDCRLIYIVYSFFEFISFYFLFSACLPTRMQNLNIYWNVATEIHIGMFAFTWFISIFCLVILIYKLTKEKEES